MRVRRRAKHGVGCDLTRNRKESHPLSESVSNQRTNQYTNICLLVKTLFRNRHLLYEPCILSKNKVVVVLVDVRFLEGVDD